MNNPPALSSIPPPPDIQFDKGLLKDLKLNGYEDPHHRKMLEAFHIIKNSGAQSLVPMLPLLFTLKGQPFNLKEHYPFEPFYRTRVPRRCLFKCGRQLGKSVSLASRGIIQSNSIPFFTTLYISPLYETIRRFSNNYVRPFIETSPLRDMMIDSTTVSSVLHRTFLNKSQMLFSYALLDAERTRGISADVNSYDEIQNLDKDFLPIIRETMAASKWGGIEQYAGTPKTLDNTIEKLWQDSSQAEWATKCHHCNHWNIPNLTYDLLKMIGPMHEHISVNKPGVVCARCSRTIYPQTGRWLHAFPERKWEFAGFHMPQLIMPFHFGNRERWSQLLGKRSGAGNTAYFMFLNEVCGESFDSGSRLITLTDLKRACVLPWPNDLTTVRQEVDTSDYIFRVLACDWGGGGEEELSYTVYAVLGMRPDGKIDVIFAHRSLRPHEHEYEARLAVQIAAIFQCHMIAHDYTGAGSLRETFVIQAGYPADRVVPVAYVAAASTLKIMQFKFSLKGTQRNYYQVDKTRSLLLTCQQIKSGWVRFFKHDYVNSEDEGLINDFIALVDEKVDSKLSRDIYRITRDPNMRDDFAQAVNIGCCTIWNALDKWPNIANIMSMHVPQALLNSIHPLDKEVLERD